MKFKVSNAVDNNNSVVEFIQNMLTYQFYNSSNLFAQKLSKLLDRDGVFSPLSIAYILSLLHIGSSDNTEQELSNLLESKSTPEELSAVYKIFNSPIMQLANAVLVNKDYELHPAYLKMIESLVMISNEDFGDATPIVEKVNNFIEENTKGLIRNILSTGMINSQTLMILINTIYFKTVWAKPFEKHLTHSATFNLNQTVDMMTQIGRYQYYEDDNVQHIELPYMHNEFCMGIILPKIASLERCYDHLLNSSFMTCKIKVLIPKFTQRTNIALVPYMQKLGLVDMFTENSKLDMMFADPRTTPFVSEIIHEFGLRPHLATLDRYRGFANAKRLMPQFR